MFKKGDIVTWSRYTFRSNPFTDDEFDEIVDIRGNFIYLKGSSIPWIWCELTPVGSLIKRIAWFFKVKLFRIFK